MHHDDNISLIVQPIVETLEHLLFFNELTDLRTQTRIK